MFDTVVYFRTEIEAVGRHWRDLVGAFDGEMALRRPSPQMNHALWLTGHMTWAEDYLINEIPAGRVSRRKESDALFDQASEKLPAEQYPAWKDVRAEYIRVHAEVMRRLSRLHEPDLQRASALERQWFPTAAHSIAHQATHGHYHLGQLVYLHKLFIVAEAATPSVSPPFEGGEKPTTPETLPAKGETE